MTTGTKWEYRFLESNLLDREFNGQAVVGTITMLTEKDEIGKTTRETIEDLGLEGWELVSTTPIWGNDFDYLVLLYIFKRPNLE